MSSKLVYKKKYTYGEALCLTVLRHPCIVEYISSDRKYISMRRYVNDLRTRMLNGAFSESRKIIIALGVAYALRHCHRLGIIHCDVKPSNILLNMDTEPVLCDFDLSVVDKHAISTRGTPMFAAPEMLSDSLAYRRSNKIDVLAYGCTLRCLDRYDVCYVHGGKLYHPLCVDDIASSVRSGGRLMLGHNTSDFFRKLIRDCWRTLPENRPSFDAICTRLEEYARSEKYGSVLRYMNKVRSMVYVLFK